MLMFTDGCQLLRSHSGRWDDGLRLQWLVARRLPVLGRNNCTRDRMDYCVYSSCPLLGGTLFSFLGVAGLLLPSPCNTRGHTAWSAVSVQSVPVAGAVSVLANTAVSTYTYPNRYTYKDESDS